MLKLIRALLFLVGLVLIVVLAIDNRGHVDVVFWPLPYSINVPLYWVFLFGLASGVILGGLSVWLSGHHRRAEFRRVSARAKELDQQERARRDAEERALVEEARRKTAALAITPPSRIDGPAAALAGTPGTALAAPRAS
jgi:uncharacterized integral membrane protein